MFKEIEKGHFYRILQYGFGENTWYAVEDLYVKTVFSDYLASKLYTKRTKLTEGLFADTVLDPETNEIHIFRLWFLAKQFTLSVVKDYARKIEKIHMQEYEKLKRYKAVEKLVESEAGIESEESSPPKIDTSL